MPRMVIDVDGAPAPEPRGGNTLVLQQVIVNVTMPVTVIQAIAPAQVAQPLIAAEPSAAPARSRAQQAYAGPVEPRPIIAIG